MPQGFYTDHVGGVVVGLPIHSSYPVAFVVLWLCAFYLFHQGSRSHICRGVVTVGFYLSTTLFSFDMAFHTYSSLHQRKEGQP